MQKIKFLVPLILILISATCFAQNKFTFDQFFHETKDFVKAPTKWDGKDFAKLGIAGLAAYLSSYADEPLQTEMQKDQSYYHSIPIEAGRIWGESYTTGIVSGLFALSGIINHNNANKRIAYEVLQSSIYAGSVTALIKFSFGRARPYMNLGNSVFKPFSCIEGDFASFSSGHTCNAFSLSTIFSLNTKSDLLKVAAYFPAVATAFSRIYQNKHWLSDTVFGAAVGCFVGCWVNKIHSDKEKLLPQQESNQLVFLSFPL
jgi:membrane-associated phospholipid phosphatase